LILFHRLCGVYSRTLPFLRFVILPADAGKPASIGDRQANYRDSSQ
jgi:hypothetical protein